MKKRSAEKVIDSIFGKHHYTPSEVIKLKRKSWNMTQKDVSEITGIPENNISAYESGRLNIGWEIAKKLAIALAIHPNSIMCPNGEDYYQELEEMAQKAQAVRQKKAVS